MKYAIAALLAFFTVGAFFLWIMYTQLYNQNSKTTATSGIYFQKTLNLKEYKNVATGNDLWGTYHRYTRSDRHNDMITVYCHDYCNK